VKKRYWFLIILGVVVIAAGLYLLNQQRVAKFFTMPTTANEPGLMLHGNYFASSLVTPKKLDFVIFNFNHEMWGDGEWVFRLIAEAGDTIQIKDAITFVNGVNIDAQLKLKHSFLLNNKEFQIMQSLGYDHDSYAISNTQYITHLPDSLAMSHGFLSAMKDSSEVDDAIEKVYGHPWNSDQFGPYIIPEDSFFVLGDNRHNAMDSRFIGVIRVSEIVGVIK